MAYSRSLQDVAFQRTRNRLLLIQAVLVVIAAGIVFPVKGTEFGMALLYGGAVSIAGTLVSAWRLRIAAEEASQNPAWSVAEFYKSALLRFVVVAALLAIGLGYFRLHGLALLVGFVVAQTGYFFSRPMRAR